MNEGQRQLLKLGEFVLAFARVEAYLRLTITEYGRVPEVISKLMISGARTEDAIKYLRKLFEVGDLDEKMLTSYEEVFAHLDPIKVARNSILHHGIDRIGYGFGTTNIRKTIDPDDAYVIPISADILEQMTHDLEKMTSILINNLLQLDGTSPSALALDPGARKPWRYTPPKPRQKAHQKNHTGQRQGKTRGSPR